jgi:hypothetical protein
VTLLSFAEFSLALGGLLADIREVKKFFTETP